MAEVWTHDKYVESAREFEEAGDLRSALRVMEYARAIHTGSILNPSDADVSLNHLLQPTVASSAVSQIRY